MSKTRRRGYTGSKAVDKSCRNHESCPHCEGNRTYKNKKRKLKSEAELEAAWM